MPPLDSNDSGRDLWLKLFNAQTEEELAEIEKLGVPIMSEALQAYRHVAASDEFIQMEKMRSKTRHDEAQALRNAERRAAAQRDEHWQGVVADKDVLIADKDVENAKLRSQLAELKTKLRTRL